MIDPVQARNLDKALELIADAECPAMPDSVKLIYLASAIDIIDAMITLEETKYLA